MTFIIPKTTKPVQWPKNRNVDMKKLAGNGENNGMGDTQATGIAIMVSCFDLMMSVIILALSQKYPFGMHTGIQAMILGVLVYDIFVGLLFTCYIMAFQAIFILICFFGEMTNPDRSILSKFFPSIPPIDPIPCSIIAFFLLAWTVFRFCCCRRAMHYIYIDRVFEKATLADVEAGAKH